MTEETIPTTVTTVRIPTHLYGAAKKQNFNFSSVMRHALEGALKINSTEIEQLKKGLEEKRLKKQILDADINLLEIRLGELENLSKTAENQEQAEESENIKRKKYLIDSIITLSKTYDRVSDKNGRWNPMSLLTYAKGCGLPRETLKSLVRDFAWDCKCDPRKIPELLAKRGLGEGPPVQDQAQLPDLLPIDLRAQEDAIHV